MNNLPDLKEIRNRILEIYNRLNFLIEKKELNFQKTQPGSPLLKTTMVDTSRNIVDTFALYMIKDAEYDQEIQDLRDNLLVWVKYYNEEVKRLEKYDDLLMIEFLKNELNWKWKDIDAYLHYAEGGAKKKYYRHTKKRL
jgi:hypothetical protein